MTPTNGNDQAPTVQYVDESLCTLVTRTFLAGDRLTPGDPEPPLGAVVKTENVDGVITWLRTVAGWTAHTHGPSAGARWTWLQVVLDAQFITVIHPGDTAGPATEGTT